MQPSSLAPVGKTASVVAGLPNTLRLEGLTDARLIRNSRVRSNWELSSARAIAMLEWLQIRFDAGYSDDAPSDKNDAEDGRPHNRRVDPAALSQGMKSEPLPSPGVQTAVPPK